MAELNKLGRKKIKYSRENGNLASVSYSEIQLTSVSMITLSFPVSMQTKDEMGLSLDHMLNKPGCCSLYLECLLQAHVLKAFSSASGAVGR